MFDWKLDGITEPVVTQKFEIEYGDESKSLAQLESSDYQNIEARIRLNDYLYEHYWTSPGFDAKNHMREIGIEFFSLGVKLLIVTLMKEIKAAVTERHNCDNRDESVLVTTFWNFWTIKNLMQGLISLVYQSNPPLQE